MNSSGKTITFELTAEGLISKWVTYFPIDNKENSITKVDIPANGQASVKVRIAIPENTANGKYIGSLMATTLLSSSSMSSTNSVQIKQKLDRDVHITVTDNQILAFNTIFIPVSYTVARDEPLKVRMIHENSGNVDIKPNVEMVISQNGAEVFKAIFPYPANESAVEPNERKEIANQIEWRTKGYELGQYNVTLSTFEGDQLNKKEEFILTVNNGGSSAGMLGANLSFIFKNKPLIWAAIAGAIALFALVMFKNKVFLSKK
jgi:uncharacterized membrane protein